jgi:uncharacterized damage-inducible protein DinB
MRKKDLTTLFDYSYWANGKVLEAAGRLTDAEFNRPSNVTTRDLRATLVHVVDVDWSWRKRLQGEPKSVWEQELDPTEYAGPADVTAHARADEREMRAWLESLDDESLARPVDASVGEVRLPLWQFLVHLLTHDAQQRCDAATLLSLAGQSPGDLDFLDYVDATREADTP